MRMNSENKSKMLKIMMYVMMALMLAAIIVLSVFLGMYTNDRSEYRSSLNNMYSMAYYDLVESMVSIENDLTKFGVISGAKLREQTLNDVRLAAKTASSAILLFSNENNSTRSLEKFINQVGDYSASLVIKLESGEEPGAKEIETIANMAQLAREISRKLSALGEQMTDKFNFVDSFGGENDIFGDMFNDLNGEQGVKFPTLIYDGPFSDGIADREPLGIHGSEITQEEAISLSASVYLKEYDVAEITVIGENNYRIPSYVLKAVLKGSEERNVTLQIAKTGGMLLDLDLYREIGEPELTLEEAAKVAEQYTDSIGMKNMKAVWISNNQSIVYINLCYNDKDVVFYPDMVKVKVSLDTGEIMGYEALNYAFNHMDRQLSKPKISEEDVMLSVPKDMKEITCRLTLIPMTTLTEKLSYEISGKIGEERYFIYFDANTGEEIRCLRVIDSSQGELLM